MSEEEGSGGVIEEEYDETSVRDAWAILTWITVGLTIVLNLILLGVLVIKRNLHSIANKLIFCVALSDLVYGCMVSPFFVENYVRLNWEQSLAYCRYKQHHLRCVELCAAGGGAHVQAPGAPHLLLVLPLHQ